MPFSTTSTDLEPNVAVITTGIRENTEKHPLEEMLLFYTKELKCFAKQVSGNMS